MQLFTTVWSKHKVPSICLDNNLICASFLGTGTSLPKNHYSHIEFHCDNKSVNNQQREQWVLVDVNIIILNDNSKLTESVRIVRMSMKGYCRTGWVKESESRDD